MAYLDLNSGFVPAAPATGVPAAGTIAIEPDHRAEFSALEWHVVALAARDSLASLREPGAVSRAFGSLFGTGRQSRLADPRLEALRRFAVHAWHRGYALPVSELDAFVEAGFAMDQAETVIASVTGARAGQQRRRAA